MRKRGGGDRTFGSGGIIRIFFLIVVERVFFGVWIFRFVLFLLISVRI